MKLTVKALELNETAVKNNPEKAAELTAKREELNAVARFYKKTGRVLVDEVKAVILEDEVELEASAKAFNATHIKGAKLELPNIWKDLGLTKDSGGRWSVNINSHEAAIDYIKIGGYRTPSRAWPLSHATPLLTQKFAKFITKEYPALAIKLGVAE